jgi:serine protease Do
VGELIASVTYPFGSESSLSLGIVSRYSKIENGSFGYGYIQTDTSVGPGASGGPLVNMKGHAVGMVTMASQTGNMGFAIPINVIKKMIPKLINKEQVAWGWLGVRVGEVTLELASKLGLSPARGVIISHVMPGQPAWQSDLMAQDVVLAIDGVSVDSPREFIRMIGGTEAGREVSLRIFRGGQLFSRSVLLGNKPKSSEEREG